MEVPKIGLPIPDLYGLFYYMSLLNSQQSIIKWIASLFTVELWASCRYINGKVMDALPLFLQIFIYCRYEKQTEIF